MRAKVLSAVSVASKLRALNSGIAFASIFWIVSANNCSPLPNVPVMMAVRSATQVADAERGLCDPTMVAKSAVVSTSSRSSLLAALSQRPEKSIVHGLAVVRMNQFQEKFVRGLKRGRVGFKNLVGFIRPER